MFFLQEALVFLAAAVLIVPLFKRLGLGAVLGYLVAGACIGPSALGWVADPESILHFAELGVVFLLFVIGLELQPSRLYALRKPIFGLGGAQVLATAAVFAPLAHFAGLGWGAAIFVGLALSASSTALVLQVLAERKQLATHYGRNAFAILLFQDLAAIPLLAVIPALAPQAASGDPLWLVLKAVLVILAAVLGGRWLLRPALRLVALSDHREIFTAAALLVVVSMAWLMSLAGLSMALGAFLAGVLLAESEYRHELEADIEPFKGLLLGLFFIAVGMSADLGLVLSQPALVFGLVAAIMGLKFGVVYALARFARQSHGNAFKLGLHLAQGGEFAFVLFQLAVGARVLESATADLLVIVVSISMAFTPVLIGLNTRVFKFGEREPPPREFDRIDPTDHRVIIAGFGRYGQMVARTLRMKKIPFTVLEASFEQVDFVSKFGNKVYFGDASRLDMLRAAKADQAEAFVLAIDDVEASVRTAEMVRRHFPDLKIFARARNRPHAYRLMDLGVEHIQRETFHSSLESAREVLIGLGVSEGEASEAVRRFREHDEGLLASQHAIYKDEAQLIASVQQGATELERLFEEDRSETPEGEAAEQGRPI